MSETERRKKNNDNKFWGHASLSEQKIVPRYKKWWRVDRAFTAERIA